MTRTGEIDEMINETHARELTSWVPGAESAGGEFPIQNLPLGAFIPKTGGPARLGVAIGDRILDLRAASEDGLLTGASEVAASACKDSTLNGLMALGPLHWHSLRLELSRLLRTGSDRRANTEPHLRRHAEGSCWPRPRRR